MYVHLPSLLWLPMSSHPRTVGRKGAMWGAAGVWTEAKLHSTVCVLCDKRNSPEQTQRGQLVCGGTGVRLL